MDFRTLWRDGEGFWRVWVGDDMQPQVFTNATDAKAYAATLTAVAA